MRKSFRDKVEAVECFVSDGLVDVFLESWKRGRRDKRKRSDRMGCRA